MPSLTVNEIFHSIQGESSHAGRPCVFVRLTACNLRCVWCDTAYAFEEGREMTIPEILEDVRKFNCNLVEITGGEPLVQKESLALMRELCDRGYEVLLETGGSIDISGVDPRVKRIVDLKCPESGMEPRNDWRNVQHLRAQDEVKFVVNSETDFAWSIDTVRRHDLDRRCQIIFSPVFGAVEPADLAQWLLRSGIRARMQMQMHKLIWSPEARGV